MPGSWSKTKKLLEEQCLCEALRGRVSYFMTAYHGAPDACGRFCVRVDGREYVRANPYNENRIYARADALQKQLGVPRRQWDGKRMVNDAQNLEVERLAEAQAMRDNEMDVGQVMRAVDEFLGLDIARALSSDNEVVRMLAVLDRRVGKRTLARLSGQLGAQPAWLRFFYELRLSAEGIRIPKKTQEE